MKKRHFLGKTIFISGGSSGIGLATAKRFCKAGANVFIFARDLNRLSLAVQEIIAFLNAENQRIDYMQLDVSSFKTVKDVMYKAVDDFGIPDILINCAGYARPQNFNDVTHDHLDDIMKVNFYGTWNMATALIPYLKQKNGHIVNVASIGGFIGLFGYTDYCASKFAVMGFSEALKSELKQDNITVSVLCPPDTDTPGFEVENKTKPAECKAISKNVKLKSADYVAKILINGIRKKKYIILPGIDSKITYFAKRHFPGFVESVMDKQIAKCYEY